MKRKSGHFDLFRCRHSMILGLSLFAWPLAVSAAPIEDTGRKLQRFSNPAIGVEMLELNAARDAFRKGKLDECRERLEKARQKLSEQSGRGELPPVDLMLARLYFSNGKADIAKGMLEKIAVDHEGHPEVYLLFGNLALAEGRWTDAALHFEKSLNVGRPAGWSEDQAKALWRESYTGQAAVAERRKDWFRAQVALAQCVKVEPDNADLRDRYGAALFMLGREKEGFEQFQTAARLDEAMNPAEVSMAVMFARKDDFYNAKKAFEAALKRYPSDGRVHYEMASVLLLNDKATEAKQHADKAAEMGIDTPEFAMQRGYIARQLRDFSAAEKHFSQVLLDSPSDFEAINQLALVLIEQDDETKQQRALSLADLNARRAPQSSHALSTLGWVYYKLGRKDEALRTLSMAVSRAPVRTESLYYLTRVLWESGKHEDARKLAEQMKPAIDRPGLFVLRPEVKQWFKSASL